MTLKTVPLSTLCPSKDNPRRRIDKAAIASLAESIKTDGVLQNLVVERNGDGKFRVITGSRRFLALKLLKRGGAIDGDYKVPVEIRNVDDGDALRIATVENVQRADLEPIEEAEAFAKMLQTGATIEDVSAKTGLSEPTIQALSDEDLAQLTSILVLLSFGQSSMEALDTGESLFNEIAAGLDLAMRDWWTPDAELLPLLRKDQLEAVAIECGASLRMGKLKGYGKKELVDALARYFERTADRKATLDTEDQKGRSWLPGVMCFPARPAATSKI